MAQFKDGAGRTWTLRVTCASFDKLERSTGLSFKDIGRALSRAGLKVSIACELAYHSRQESEPPVSYEEFCEALVTAAQMNAMIAAVSEACELFFQSQKPSQAQANPGPGATSTK